MKKNIKRFFSITILGLVLFTLLCACGNTGTGVTEETTEAESYTSEELWLSSDYGDIYGIMYLPAEEKDSYPTIILAHAYSETSKNIKDFAEQFAEAGYAAYIFDFVNGSPNSKSGNADGTMHNMSVMTQKSQLDSVLEQVRALDYVDESKVALFGRATGAVSAALLAAEKPDEIKALILQYPGFNLAESVAEVYPSADDVPEILTWADQEVSRIFVTDLLGVDLYEMISAYKGDVLIQHGALDDRIDISVSQKAVDAYESAQLIVYENGYHGFGGSEVRQETIDDLLDFLDPIMNS